MKWMLLLSFFLMSGMSQSDVKLSNHKEDPTTSCITKADLDKQELRNFKYRGVCLLKVNGRGYACVKKGLFRKSNCVGMKIEPETEK